MSTRGSLVFRQETPGTVNIGRISERLESEGKSVGANIQSETLP